MICRYNIRDMFEIYRRESDPANVQELVTAGWKNLEVMKKFGRLDEHTLREIFKPWTDGEITLYHWVWPAAMYTYYWMQWSTWATPHLWPSICNEAAVSNCHWQNMETILGCNLPVVEHSSSI